MPTGAEAAAFSGLPPVILLHGFAQHGSSWDGIAAMLRARGFQVSAPDLREVAESAETSGVSDPLDAVCRGIAALARSVGEGTAHPPVAVGYSMGGRLALETLVRFPHGFPICGLVLESAGLGPASDADRAATRRRSEARAVEVLRVGVGQFMDAWEKLPLFASQQNLAESVRSRVREGRLANSADDLALQLDGWGQHRQAARAQAFAVLSDLTRRGVPVRYVTGELDGKYAALAQELARETPGVDVRLILEAGHNTHLEQPERFVSAVAEGW